MCISPTPMLIIWVEPFPGSHMQALAHSNSMGGRFHIFHMRNMWNLPPMLFECARVCM